MIPAAVVLDLAEQCRFVDCRFAHLGGSGLWFRQTCIDNRVERCRFDDISGNGLNIGETHTRKLPAATVIKRPDPLPDLCCRRNRVTDCLLENCGAQFFGAVGLWIGIAAENEIAHNELRNLPYTGVSVGWMWNTSPSGCRANVVRNNHIHHVMQVLSDGGGIYTLGRQPGAALRNNRIHDVPLNAGRAESNGIFMDQGSSEILVQGQVIYGTERSPIRFHQAAGVTLKDNVLVTRPGVPPLRYNRADPATMTFAGNKVIETDRWTPPDDSPARAAGIRP
jgi:hypothetical protein